MYQVLYQVYYMNYLIQSWTEPCGVGVIVHNFKNAEYKTQRIEEVC